ncbi:DB module domain-containing protein [Ditylenchus destructor]|uniref:DB module domain-containing protein n=1 Tax=Ditylenchus destructor TaxID=166010 RepID=A0AAD4QZC3_9BILA|nr:DB module domain-containing protein [Ditylenchus destructor]
MWPLQLLFPSVIILSFIPSGTESCAASGICGGPPSVGSFCGGPPPPQPLQPIFPPAPQPGYRTGMCPAGGCGSYRGNTYGCGPYGCYRMRARGSTLFQPGSTKISALKLLQSHGKISELEKNGAAIHDDGRSEPLEEIDELAASSPSAAAIRRALPTKPINPNRAFMECCLDRQLPDACLQKCHFSIYNKEALTKMYFKQDGCPMDAMREIQFCAAQGKDHTQCCERNGVTTTLAGEKCLTFCDQRPGKVIQLDMTYLPCFDRFENMKSCFWHDLARFYRS